MISFEEWYRLYLFCG